MQIRSIYIDSFDLAHSAQTKKLKELFRYSSTGKYLLIDDPDKSDIILLCDAEFENFCKKIRENVLLKKYKNKCFVLSNSDRPITLYRGLYTSAEKSSFNFGRIRSCSYTAYFDPYKNSYISGHSSKETINKKYLFSFVGRNCDKIRDLIFKLNFSRKDIFIENTTEIYNLYSNDLRSLSREKIYYNTLLNSKFSLCPRGWGAASFRLFESMQLGVAPVIISDEWLLPKGPKWEEFSIMVKSKDIKNLEKILTHREGKYIEMGKLAKFTFEQFYSEDKYFDYVIKNCLEIKSKQLLPESFHYYLNYLLLFYLKAINKVKSI